MDQAGFLSALELESSRMAGVAEGGLSRPVGSCPGWEVKDVVGHLGSVYAWAASAVAGGGERPGPMEAAPEDEGALLPWFVHNRDALLASFAGRAARLSNPRCTDSTSNPESERTSLPSTRIWQWRAATST